jgi:hypothetical protein
VIVIVATGFLGYWRSWGRPFWDWLALLIIPVVLGLGGVWFNNQARKSEQALAREERENDREIAVDQARRMPCRVIWAECRSYSLIRSWESLIKVLWSKLWRVQGH